MLSTTVDKDVTITNNASVDVITLDAYDPDAVSGTSTEQGYEQTLTLYPTTDGSQTIAASGNATVELDGTYVDGNGNTQYRTLYELIFARPADLFPVKNTAEMLGITNPVYPPITISTDDQSNMVLAMTFLANIQAYPTSNLAQNFQAALNGAQSTSNSPSDIDDAMNAFFQSTKQYQTLTLNTVTIASTYMTTFAYTWAGATSDFAGFQSSITYYLYMAGQAPAGSNQAPPTAMGTLTMVRQSNAPAVASTTDYNGGYTITYTDADGKVTPLYYQSGQFVSSLDEDIPTVALRGGFTVKSYLTNDTTNDNVIIPMLAGSVNGRQVIGVTVQQTGESEWYAFFHPDSIQGWINLFLDFFGIAMAIEFTIKMVQKFANLLKKLFASKDPPPQDEIEQARDEANQDGDQLQEDAQAQADQLGENIDVPAPQELGGAIGDGRDALGDQNDVQRGDVLEDALQSQSEQVEVLAEYGVSPELAQVADGIRDDYGALQGAENPDQLSQAIEQASNDVPDFSDQIGQITDSLSSQLSSDAKNALEESQANVEEMQEYDEAAEETGDGIDDGLGGDDDIPIDF